MIGYLDVEGLDGHEQAGKFEMSRENPSPATRRLSVHEDLIIRLKPSIDATLKRLSEKKFREDPIGGRKYSRATSIISSAYKRHGTLLVEAIVARLNECPRLQVWREGEFTLSTESLQVFREIDNVEKLLTIDLTYGECERTIPLDMVVFDKEKRSLRSYNIKRGNGSYDAGKRRSIMRDLVRTDMLLSGYGKGLGFEVNSSAAQIVFYYGLKSIPAPFSISGEELDDHFEFSTFEAIEAVNDYFRERLYALIEDEG